MWELASPPMNWIELFTKPRLPETVIHQLWIITIIQNPFAGRGLQWIPYFQKIFTHHSSFHNVVLLTKWFVTVFLTIDRSKMETLWTWTSLRIIMDFTVMRMPPILWDKWTKQVKNWWTLHNNVWTWQLRLVRSVQRPILFYCYNYYCYLKNLTRRKSVPFFFLV